MNLLQTPPPIEQASYSGIFLVFAIVLFVAVCVAAVVALAPRAKNSDLVPPRSSSPVSSNRKSGRTQR